MTSVLYGARGGSAASSDLYTIDETTGAATSVGAIGRAITGLAFDPIGGTLYAATTKNSAVDPHSLITIDPATGAGTLVGDFGSGTQTPADIAFDSSGQLYGIFQGARLATINKATGGFSYLTGVQGTTYGGAFDIDGSDVGWVLLDGDLGNVYEFDLGTGLKTQDSAISGSPFADGSAFSAGAFTSDKSVFYAALNDFGSPVDLVTVDLATGVVSDIGATLAAPPLDAIAWGAGVSPDPLRPVVNSFTPTSGTVHTPITLSGLHFTGATVVKVNGVSAPFTVDSDSRISTGVPAGASGAGSITVTSAHGTGSKATFTVIAGRPNDNDYDAVFADAYELASCPISVTVHDSNLGATKQGGEPNFNGTVGGHSVWWWWHANGNGSVTVTVAGDTLFGTPLTSPLLLVYDADSGDFTSPLAQGTSSVTFTAEQDVDYAIGVDGAAGQEGDFTLALTHPARPGNDLYGNRQVLVGDSGSVSGATSWACDEDSDPAGFYSVWYAWTPTVSGWAKLAQTLTDALSLGGRQFAVYTGGPGAWTPVLRRSASGAGDVAAASEWDLYFEAAAGATYLLIVSGQGVGADRFTLDYSVAMDLADVEPGDVVAGPSVSTTTTAVPEATSGGTWLRFEFEHSSGALPVTDVGLVQVKNAADVVIGEIRLVGDSLQARAGSADSWVSLGKPATIGPGLAKVRVEAFYTDSYGRLRVNGVGVGVVLGAGPPTSVDYGCLWNTAADAIEVLIENIGIRVDPALGPWDSTDAADKGVSYLWGGEGGELGRSSGGTDWLASSGAPTVAAAPGVGASPVGRYGNALVCTTTTGTVRQALIGDTFVSSPSPFGFSRRAPCSFYFFTGDYPDSLCSIGKLWDGDNTHRVDLRLGATGLLEVAFAAVSAGNVRHVSLGRWHHVELYLDALSPGWPTRVRLNGVEFGPFYANAGGVRTVTAPFVPTQWMCGNNDAAANFGLAVKDMTVYHQNSYPLGGQTIRKRVPDGVGAHDADVDEWVAGVNQQTPTSDGDARLDYSGYTVGSHDPADWKHNLHYADTTAPDDATKKILVDTASFSPPAAMVGQKVLTYLSKPPGTSGAYIDIPTPRIDPPHRYLIEAWVYKDANGDGKFDSETFPVFDQSWPWTDVVSVSFAGWFFHGKERTAVGFNADQFGPSHPDAGPYLYQIGPIKIWEDYVYEPRATGFWQSSDDGATYTSIQDTDTTTYTLISEWPPAAGGNVIGVGPATPGWDLDLTPTGNSEKHLEYTLQNDDLDTEVIYAARLYVRGRSYSWANRSFDSSDGSIVYPSRAASSSSGSSLYAQDVSGSDKRWLPPLQVTRASSAVGTYGHDSAMLPVGPGDAAWTLADWDANRLRLGFPATQSLSSSAVMPVVEAFAYELLVPEAELPPEGGGAHIFARF